MESKGGESASALECACLSSCKMVVRRQNHADLRAPRIRHRVDRLTGEGTNRNASATTTSLAWSGLSEVSRLRTELHEFL